MSAEGEDLELAGGSLEQIKNKILSVLKAGTIDESVLSLVDWNEISTLSYDEFFYVLQQIAPTPEQKDLIIRFIYEGMRYFKEERDKYVMELSLGKARRSELVLNNSSPRIMKMDPAYPEFKEVFDKLCELLKSSTCHIKCLCIHYCNLGLKENEVTLIKLCKALSENTTVTELSLSFNEINASGVMIICRELKNNKTLEKIDLSDNQLSDDGASVILDFMKVNPKPEIYLWNNVISDRWKERQRSKFNKLEMSKTVDDYDEEEDDS